MEEVYTLRKAEEVKPAMQAEYDLIDFVSGIYRGKNHETLLDFVAGSESNSTHGGVPAVESPASGL